MAPSNAVFRNREAMGSEPRFVQQRPMSGKVYAEPMTSLPHLGTPGRVNWAAGEDIVRPHTTGPEDPRVAGPVEHSLNSVRSDPMLNPHAEPQSAEFLTASPKKKLSKRQH